MSTTPLFTVFVEFHNDSVITVNERRNVVFTGIEKAVRDMMTELDMGDEHISTVVVNAVNPPSDLDKKKDIEIISDLLKPVHNNVSRGAW